MNRLKIISRAAIATAPANAASPAKPARRRQSGAAAESATGGGTLDRPRLHHIERPPLHFVIGPAKIFAQYPDADELHAAEKKHERDDRGEPGECDFHSEQSANDEEQ